jgi:protein KRI1
VEEAFDDWDEWYVCDGCKKAIRPGKMRFDCKQCDNFTFCKGCYKENTTHSHSFKKKKIPLTCKPPENKEYLI